MAGALCALGEQQQQAGGALLALLMPACFIHTALRHLPAKLRWFGRYIMPGRRSSRRAPTTTTRVRVRRTRESTLRGARWVEEWAGCKSAKTTCAGRWGYAAEQARL